VLVPGLVREHAFDRGDVPASVPPGEDAVEIEADDGIGAPWPKLVSYQKVEQNARECGLTAAVFGCNDRHFVPQRHDGVAEDRDPDPGCAPLGDSRRRAGDENQAGHEVCIKRTR